jgi:hypothetical protein
MHGFLSRIVGLILAFLMLIIAPLINAYGVQEMENKVELLNDVSEFLDKQTDKGGITDEDMDQFYVNVQSHGMILDVKVDRLVKTATESGDGTIHTTYIAADDNTILNKHDILKVKITEKSSTPYKRLLNVVLRMDDNPYKLEMAKMVK